MIKQLGKWKLYALETGDFRLDGGAMMGSVPKVLWEKTNPSDNLNRIDLALRCLLLDDGNNKILIETGMGDKLDDKFKKMFHVIQKEKPINYELDKIGCDIHDITHVILTHLHFDHAGGATTIDIDGRIVPTFPNAKYYISSSNWEAGLNPNPRDKASYLQDNYLPLYENGCLNIISENTKILDNISTIVVNGHTFGQQLVKIDCGKEALIFCADLIPLKSHLQLPWIMGYDLNAVKTLEEKTKFLKEASDNNWWLWFYHDPEVVAVKIKASDKYYDGIDEVRRV